MPTVALEAAIVTEHANGYATLALNNDILEDLEQPDRDKLVKSLLVLARQKLARDIVSCSKERLIARSVDRSHDDFVLQLKLLVDAGGKFTLLTYFGGAAEPTTPLRRGLHHAVEVIGAVEARGL